MCWANDDGVVKSCKGAPGFEIIINKQLFLALNRQNRHPENTGSIFNGLVNISDLYLEAPRDDHIYYKYIIDQDKT